MDLSGLRGRQLELAGRVVLEDSFDGIKSVGGVDVAYDREGGLAYGACVVLDYESLDVVEERTVKTKITFPYVPPFLSFREYPVMERVYRRIKNRPTVLLVDGNGILHPYRIGLASHVGVLLDQPTIGVAKSLLCGRVDKGGRIVLDGRVVGYAHSTNKTKPIYVSPGHKVSLETSIKVVGKLCRHRIPEPIRIAHVRAGEMKVKDLR
jgi:deoxyribonuclease V